MGGNATKQFNPQRLNTKEAKGIGESWAYMIRKMCARNVISPLARVILSYRNKETHGDIDIVVSNEILKYMAVEEIVETYAKMDGFDTFPIFKNGNVVSIANFLDKEKTVCFQVDLIFVPERQFDFAYGYFAYNDLGNLIGRVAHKMGLKFGHDGLWYPFRVDENYLFKEILVTDNFPRAMEFLGFSIDKWDDGFDDLEDIFEYVCESDRFNRDLYPLEHRSHKARIRDRKRPSYTAFLKHLDDHPEIPNGLDVYPEDKDVWVPRLFAAFPEFEDEYVHVKKELEISIVCKDKLNGSDFQRITGLEGKELGKFIREWRKYLGLSLDSVYKYAVYTTEKELLEQAIFEFKEIYDDETDSL